MLRLVPPQGTLGETEGDGDCGLEADGRGLEGPVDGVVGVQLPLDSAKFLPAPAVWSTTLGTQLAPSSRYEYGTLTVVLDGMLGPAGLVSLPGLDQVTLSRMLPLACQVPASLV